MLEYRDLKPFKTIEQISGKSIDNAVSVDVRVDIHEKKPEERTQHIWKEWKPGHIGHITVIFKDSTRLTAKFDIVNDWELLHWELAKV